MEKSTTSMMRFQPAPGLMVAEKVRLEKLLSRGGMGAVWIGRHIGLDLPVAVKFMSDSSVDLLARFQREARAAAQIRSSNVVKIHDFGVDRGTPYIVMELLEGEDLAGRLKRTGRLSLKDTETILIPVARGLDRAHEARLVHRDLKPENIFLAREGDEEIPKILDFGVAKSLVSEEGAREVTEQGAVLGSPYYMSPEQARARNDVDHRADLWSLGVILFRMVTGVRPFQGKALGDVLLQICSDPIPIPSTLDPSLPPEIDAFFERALARDREARFQSARELARAFSAIAQAHASIPVDPNLAARAFDGAFDASGGLGRIPTSHTGVVALSGSMGSATSPSVVSLAEPRPSKGIFLGIGIAATVLVLGAIVFFLVNQDPNGQMPALPKVPAASAATLPSAPAMPSAAAPVPIQEEPVPAISATIAAPLPAEVKTAKPMPSASTKKPTRDLGY